MTEPKNQAPAATANPCCAPNVQATCCEPAEKDACCGTVQSPGGCGCR